MLAAEIRSDVQRGNCPHQSRTPQFSGWPEAEDREGWFVTGPLSAALLWAVQQAVDAVAGQAPRYTED
jgi:hypothetical protein